MAYRPILVVDTSLVMFALGMIALDRPVVQSTDAKFKVVLSLLLKFFEESKHDEMTELIIKNSWISMKIMILCKKNTDFNKLAKVLEKRVKQGKTSKEDYELYCQQVVDLSKAVAQVDDIATHQRECREVCEEAPPIKRAK